MDANNGAQRSYSFGNNLHNCGWSDCCASGHARGGRTTRGRASSVNFEPRAYEGDPRAPRRLVLGIGASRWKGDDARIFLHS